MSAKDPFEQLVDEITLIRHDVENLQRSSLSRKEAEDLNNHVAGALEQMTAAVSRIEGNVTTTLGTHRDAVSRDARKAAQSAAEGAIANLEATVIKTAKHLSQAAGEARREAWRYFGGFWVWVVSMLASGAVLGLLAANGMETAKSFFSVEQMVRYSCGGAWFGGTVVDQDNGGSFCAFWIEKPKD